MKKIFKKFLDLLLIINFIVLALIITIPNCLTDIVSLVFTKSNVTKQIINTISSNFPEIDDHILSKIELELAESNEIDKITDIYIQTFMKDLKNDTVTQIDISNEIQILLEENINQVPQGMRNLVIEKVNAINFNNIYNKVLEYAKQKIDPNMLNVIIMYETLTNENMTLILILSLLIVIGLIYYINKSIIESFYDIGISTMVAGGVLIVILFSLKIISTQLISLAFGASISINFFALGIMAFGNLILGTILLDIHDKKTN